MALLAASAGCQRPAERTPEIHATTPAAASERPVLAESANQAAQAGVQVLDARRVARECDVDNRPEEQYRARAVEHGLPAEPLCHQWSGEYRE